jgi:hypothetical protein
VAGRLQLLQSEDVRAVFGDMKVDQPRKTMEQLKYESRVDHADDLPKPIRRDPNSVSRGCSIVAT